MVNKLNSSFGIDFGTTSSATVNYTVMDNQFKEVQYGDDEGRPIPSVVAIDKHTGEVYTGRKAWEKRMQLSESCQYISSIKSVLDSNWSFEVNGEEWTPIKVTSEVFKMLKENVNNRTGQNLEDATVAIPVGFSPQKRRILRDAAKMAGINIASFISEPTAAFFANYSELKQYENVAIFDWGGGTLDVSILNHRNQQISELATSGLFIAGDNIDDKIARRIHSKIARKKGISLSYDDMEPKHKDMMLVRAERAKRALYDDETATISINNYGDFGAVRETIDYDWFAEIINPEIEQAIQCLMKTIEDSQVGISNIDIIVMIGGSSNLGPLFDIMDNKFGDKLYFPEETMWNVGQGASLLAMTPGAYYSSQDIGIVMNDGSTYHLLKSGDALSEWSRKCNFGIADTSKEARFIFDGSVDIRESDVRYRTLEIPAYKFLQEQITIEALIDENLVFQVLASTNMRSKEFARVWEYGNLKVHYRLPKFNPIEQEAIGNE